LGGHFPYIYIFFFFLLVVKNTLRNRVRLCHTCSTLKSRLNNLKSFWVYLKKMDEPSITDITNNVRKCILNILNRRGNKRKLLTEELIDIIRQHFTRQGIIIEEYKLKALQSEGKLTEIKADSTKDTKHKEKNVELEQKIAADTRLIAKYKKHFQRMEDEIKELKDKLGIPALPWYEQGKDDPIET